MKKGHTNIALESANKVEEYISEEKKEHQSATLVRDIICASKMQECYSVE